MEAFHYSAEKLFCEEVPVASIAERFGTPSYVYSQGVIRRRFQSLEQGLSEISPLICYSVKANSNLKILSFFRSAGAGFDIVSGGELARVLRVGADPKRIVFSGVGKTEAEVDAGLQAGILMFNVESAGELEMLEARARHLKKRANLSVRINPDVEAETHPYVATGRQIHKFGVPKEEAVALYREAASSRELRVLGVACHIGSQILEVEPFMKAFDEIAGVARTLGARGIDVDYLDLGGGFGIRYKDEEPLDADRLMRELTRRMQESTCRLILEPGRALVAEAGILLTRVLYTKQNQKKNFVVVDAGMNDLMRPALYGSYHEVAPVVQRARAKLRADVVGPLCETGDFLAQDRELPEVEPNDLLAVLTVGAYGFVQASNYNSRPRPAEVMVHGNQVELIRRREKLEDLMEGEVL